jgi:cell division septation protein DedD
MRLRFDDKEKGHERMQTEKEPPRDHRRIALTLMLALLIALVGGAVVRAWPLAPNALAQEAVSDEVADAALTQATIPPTIPAPSPQDLTMDLKVGPNPFCPGYRLHYDLTVTNTTDVLLEDVVITANLPVEVYNPVDGGSTVPGIHVPSEVAMVWEQGAVEPGAVVRSYVIVNSYSSVGAGTVLSTTFVITSPSLSAEGEIADGAVADPEMCPPPTATPTMTPSPTPTSTNTPTPTATATFTPTATPTPKPELFLPIVINEWLLP